MESSWNVSVFNFGGSDPDYVSLKSEPSKTKLCLTEKKGGQLHVGLQDSNYRRRYDIYLGGIFQKIVMITDFPVLHLCLESQD